MNIAVDYQLHFGDGHHHQDRAVLMEIRRLDFYYGAKQALKDINIDIYEREVLALIGPSGCGKSTFIRCLNRTSELASGARMTGTVRMRGSDIYDTSLDPVDVRRRFGLVAQKPDPFPGSIYQNVAYGMQLRGLANNRSDERDAVEHALRRANLWDEVKDGLRGSALSLSGGQQQRLCIARAIAYEPDVLLLDEPCSALDPTATAHVEELIDELRERFSIVIITHNLQQSARVSQRVAFFHLGKLVEIGDTQEVFVRPAAARTQAFITGRYG